MVSNPSDQPPPPPTARSKFFARSALVMVGLMLSAFPLSYFAPTVTGSKHFSIVHHLHGVVFFAWMGLYAWQNHLVATGRTGRHRELGLAGIAISALMLPLGVMLMIAAIRRRQLAGDPHPFDYAFYNTVDLGTFTVLVTLGIAAVTRHVDWHRRFMFGAAICLLGPAISRWFFGPWFLTVREIPPLTDWAPNLVAQLFFLALIRFDRRTLGRIHPATLWLCATLVPLNLLSPLVANSSWWRAVAPWLLRLTA